MDIVLVDSINFSDNNIMPQLGLASLHTILSKKFEVALVDFDFMCGNGEFVYSNNLDDDISRMVDYLISLNSKVYSFYTISNSYPITILIARKISEKLENVKIIFGGPQASMTVEDTLNSFPFVKAIGIGEGELYIEKLMKTVIEDGDLSKVEGIAYKKGNDIKKNAMPRLLTEEELNNISYLNFQYKNEYINKSYAVSIEAGRGCPCSCSFCSTKLFWKRNFRLRDVKIIVDEIEKLYNDYGAKIFILEHDHFTVNKELLNRFCKLMIEKNMDVEWRCSSRIDNLHEESIELMKKAGCTSIFVGFESGSSRMQKEIHKNLRIEESIEKIIYINNIGIDVTISFIYGLPDETVEDFEQTISVIDRLYKNGVKRIQLHKFMPLPKTEALEKIKDKLYLNKEDIDKSIYNDSIYSKSVFELIKEHKDCFIQFYTFDSEVRKNYINFDFFITFLSGMAVKVPQTIIELTKKYGVKMLYEKWFDDIEETYLLLSKGEKTDFYDDEYTINIMKKLYNKIINKSMEEVSNYARNIIKFESLLFNMDFKEGIVYEFDYDVLKIRAGKKNIKEKKCYMRFEKIEDGRINIKKLQPRD